MLNAVNKANKMITFGWKGGDVNFTNLLITNSKIDDIYVVSPKADTNLTEIFPQEKIKLYASTFSHFISETPTLEGLLATFDTQY